MCCCQIGELRSGSPRLVELNDFIRQLYKKKLIDVLSFCEVIMNILFKFQQKFPLIWEFDICWLLTQTKVTPIVEGYGGWAFRMEIVPMESAYPGFGELVVSFGCGSLGLPFFSTLSVLGCCEPPLSLYPVLTSAWYDFFVFGSLTFHKHLVKNIWGEVRLDVYETSPESNFVFVENWVEKWKY